MTFKSQAVGPNSDNTLLYLSSMSRGAKSILPLILSRLNKVFAGMRGVLRTLQMARMMSTLSEMSDHQLTQIGISRADIPMYAEKLLSDDWGGDAENL
ncbi:DUF1127 domain-containing protein [Ruegeria arenilitoris]|uniref:DUF1127 domain-containing protein n=1 Tax=Ruegeria arenilitoris TaxID=1173585 RepID=UPI0020C43FB6|nr:DUF1127 domain-containing protein [Ruegeria arenilitoris]